MNSKWVITCEHGGNQIPAAYSQYFRDADMVLQSHRGYDPGALALFRLLADQLADFSQYSQTSRLLVELNRSLHHKNLFSAYTKSLDTKLRQEIIASYYLPYRQLVEEKIRDFLQQEQQEQQKQQVVHLSIHSFTPELNGEIRKADIGLLYDPARQAEKAFCRQWKEKIHEVWPQAQVRLNYPYQGKADGFTTYLRRRYPQHYIGIELEINQQYAQDEAMHQRVLLSLTKLRDKH